MKINIPIEQTIKNRSSIRIMRYIKMYNILNL